MSAAIVLEGNDASWRQAHEELVRLATERAGLDFDEGRALLTARRTGAHVRLGFASFYEYTERLFGYGLRLTQDKLRVAEALEELPETAGALQTGAINFSVAREVTRVAIPSTEKEWLDAAHGRQALEGNRDPGRSSYPIALTVCESCRRATQHGRGELIEVSPEIVEMAECDAQHIGHVDAHVGVRDGDDARERVGDDAHVGVPDHAKARDRERSILVRASQTISPALRRAVLRRDGGKCRVPGCRHSAFTEPHHLVRRCEGGKHLMDNLVTLCVAHHRAAHHGALVMTGAPSSKLQFTHADGTPYGGAVAPAVADVHAKAFQALVGMGFGESEGRRALARVPHSVASLEHVIRQALRELAPQ
jgi:hypothetical protein